MPLEAESEQVGGQGGSGRLLLGTQSTYFTSTKVQMLTQKRLVVGARGGGVTLWGGRWRRGASGWELLRLYLLRLEVLVGQGGLVEGGRGGLVEAAVRLETVEVGVRLAPVRRRQV